MRELKFREWDPERESMMPGHGLSYSDREEYDDMTGFRFEHEEDFDYTTRDVATDNKGVRFRSLEQYTGIKDGKGKEIYEGDIVHVWDNDEAVVIYEKGSFLLDFSQCDSSLNYPLKKPFSVWLQPDILDPENTFKVIGNIHENPELLEEAK